MRRVAALAGLFLALVGCDLSEAEHMNLTRGGVLPVEPEPPVVLFRGRRDMNLTEFVQSLQAGRFDSDCSVEWGDRGPNSDWILGAVDVYVGNKLLVGGYPWFGQQRTIALEWLPEVLRSPETVRFELSTWWGPGPGEVWGSETIPETGLRLVDDRPSHIVSGWDGIRHVARGDTLVVEVHNPLAVPLEVWTDHQGLRTLDAYFTALAPGETTRFRWMVTASAGAEGWIEVGWGEWRQSSRFPFVVDR